jgi:hypothetical protein
MDILVLYTLFPKRHALVVDTVKENYKSWFLIREHQHDGHTGRKYILMTNNNPHRQKSI